MSGQEKQYAAATGSAREHEGRRNTLSWSSLATALAIAAIVLGACAGEPTAIDVPPPLAAVGHFGEAVYDAARAGDWVASAATLDSLHGGAAGLARTVPGTPSEERSLLAQLDTLDTGVARRERLTTLRAANEVTRLAAELSRPFRPPLPVEITLLDYDGRLLQVWADARDLQALRQSTATLRQTWNGIRPRVESRTGGVEAATRFEGLVTQAEGVNSALEYGGLATRILDEVDNLERLFPVADTPD